jgi:hypothetical protein
MSELAGSLLLRHGVVKPEQLSAAHALRQKDGGSFGEALVRIGAVDEEQLVEFYHRRLMIPRIADAKLLQVSPKVLSLVPADMAAEFRVLPVEVDNEGTITLAMSDPTNNHAVDEVAFFADRFVVRAACTESAIRRAIESHYGVRFTSPRTSDRIAAPAASNVGTFRAIDPKPTTQPMPIATKQTLPMGSNVRAQEAPKKKEEPPKPTREELEQQIVLLTKVKRSEETPLPMPVPPPEDYKPEFAHNQPEEFAPPVLLTKPKVQPQAEKRDTVPDMPVQIPDPPLAALRAAQDRDAVVMDVLDYLGLMTRRSIFFAVKKQLQVPHDARGELDASLVGQLAINIEAPSIFRDVIASRLPYRGPLPDTAANRAFAQTVGGIGAEVLLMPVAIRERIIAVVFADQPTMPLPDAALHATIREAGLAYERIVLAQKNR